MWLQRLRGGGSYERSKQEKAEMSGQALLQGLTKTEAKSREREGDYSFLRTCEREAQESESMQRCVKHARDGHVLGNSETAKYKKTEMQRLGG